jgi:hypothetical protein
LSDHALLDRGQPPSIPFGWYAIAYSDELAVGEVKPIWDHKRFDAEPQLVQGDGPIHKFRKYFSQFYVENSGCISQDTIEPIPVQSQSTAQDDIRRERE